MALQHLRSSTAHKRPIPTVMSAGQIAINTNEASPALFFKDSNGDLVKVGPVHIGTDAPNSSPASVAATALVTGTVYQILTVGTTDFTLVGASANTVGIIFTATGTTTGTGTASGQQGVEKGEMWLDTTGGAYDLKIYDGTSWRSQAGEFVNVTGDTMTGALLLDNAASASAPDLSFDGDADTGVYSPGANQVAIATGGNGRVFIDSSGNVGIGTSSPNDLNGNADDLVVGSGSGNRGISVYSGTGSLGSIYFADGTSGNAPLRGAITYNHSDDSLKLLVNASERMRIDSSGKVGVGTSSPSNKLHVEANNSSADLVYFNNTGVTASDVLRLNTTGTGAGTNIFDAQAGGTSRFLVRGDGNVGIGTTSPSYKVDIVSATDAVALNIRGRSADNIGTIYFRSNDNGTTNGLIQGRSDGFRITTGSSSQPIVFRTDSERMRIDGSGRVGIGTSSPSQKLDVSTGYLNFTDNYGIRWGGATSTAFYGNSASNFIAFQTGTNERMRINNLGDVGVGTTAPTYYGGNFRTLEISGSAGNDGGIFSTVSADNAVKAYFYAESTGDTATIGTVTNHPFLFRTNSVERMRIDTAGRLLVNKSATASNGALAQFASSVGPHISVNSTGASSAFMLFQNSATGDANNNGYYLGVDGSQQAYVWNYSNTGIYFGVNGATVGRFIGTKFNVPGVYNGITTGGGPVYVESDGDLLRYTSSLKYKTDVETLEDARADAILNCRPVWYRSKCENDIKTEGAEKSDWGWYGFIAEEVAEIEPRLVNWATKDSVEQEDKTTLSVERDPADYEAEGVRYDNFVPLMLNLIKRQKAQIETLERRLSDAGIA